MNDLLLNDLFMLDPSNNTWSDLTYNATGPRPSRYAHGFASADNKLFVFGGSTNNGESVRGVERKAWGGDLVGGEGALAGLDNIQEILFGV